MSDIDWIGFIGVTILLLAYLLNLLGRIKRDSFVYLSLNTIGAGIACLASIFLNYLPFVLLEGCWTVVSAMGLLNYILIRKQNGW